MTRAHSFPVLSGAEAAALIPDGATIGFSGFTAAGSAKAVPRALAQRASEARDRGEPLRFRVLTGASTGPDLDDALAEADAIAWRAPYQSSRPLRDRINRQETEFVDMHLSHVPQMVEYGFFGDLDFAVAEAVDLAPDGRVYLSTSVGATPSYLHHAERVIIELNRHCSPRLAEMHDIAIVPPPPRRDSVQIDHALARVGVPYATVDPAKVVGVVETDQPDGVRPFEPPDPISERIAENVVRFLIDEVQTPGRIPPEFLPMQAGVGNTCNAVMARIGRHPDIPPFDMYSEVVQDSLIDLMVEGRLRGASTCSLTLSDPVMARVFDDMDFFAPRLVLRPQQISNNPGIVRRLGVISINTVLELDVYGCANSTHVCGTRLMNGIGGAGDFVRNAALSILVTPSTAKGGRISCVVPMVSHVDHNEHSVQVVATEHGLADLRGLGPAERAATVIERCAHPAYRPYLRDYVASAPMGHFRHDLGRCFELHRNLLEHGAMLPDLELDES